MTPKNAIISHCFGSKYLITPLIAHHIDHRYVVRCRCRTEYLFNQNRHTEMGLVGRMGSPCRPSLERTRPGPVLQWLRDLNAVQLWRRLQTGSDCLCVSRARPPCLFVHVRSHFDRNELPRLMVVVGRCAWWALRWELLDGLCSQEDPATAVMSVACVFVLRLIFILYYSRAHKWLSCFIDKVWLKRARDPLESNCCAVESFPQTLAQQM